MWVCMFMVCVYRVRECLFLFIFLKLFLWLVTLAACSTLTYTHTHTHTLSHEDTPIISHLIWCWKGVTCFNGLCICIVYTLNDWGNKGASVDCFKIKASLFILMFKHFTKRDRNLTLGWHYNIIVSLCWHCVVPHTDTFFDYLIIVEWYYEMLFICHINMEHELLETWKERLLWCHILSIWVSLQYPRIWFVRSCIQ